MLCKCVLGSGIKNKQAIEITEHNNYKIFYLKEWGEDQLKLVLFDGYLFPIGFDLERIKNHLNRITDFKQALINEFEYTIKQGKGVSTGLGQYLNREQDVIKFNEEQNKKQIEEAEQRKKEEQLRQIQEQEEQDKLLHIEEDRFKKGERITNNNFIMLCNKYNITLPIKFKGWCLKTLCYVTKETYLYKRGGNRSTVIYDYIDKLVSAINRF